MVVAIREKRKTMTRRVIKSKDVPPAFASTEDCPYGQVGDRLWVREAWGIGGDRLVDPCLNYKADGAQIPIHRRERDEAMLWETPGLRDRFISNLDLLRIRRGWRPSIHMPRWASRILLEITGVNVEQVQSISEEDAQAEGTEVSDYAGAGYGTHRSAFHALWDSINGERPGCAWKDNPWVWCVSFKEVEGQ